MTVCIDTNVILGMFGRAAPFLPLRQGLLTGKFIWAVSTEILMEYEEVTVREMGREASENLLRFIEVIDLTRSLILHVSPDFRFRVITSDPDDNKFADCAISAHAEFVITEDRHFRSMVGSGFKPQPITPEEFIRRFL